MRWLDSSVGEGGYLDLLLYRIKRDMLQYSRLPAYAACLTRMKDDPDGGLDLPILFRSDRTTAPGRTRTIAALLEKLQVEDSVSNWQVPGNLQWGCSVAASFFYLSLIE